MKVTVYSTRHCGFCVAARGLLDRLGIAYENVDVTGDRAARVALVQLAGGRRTVPVIVIDGEVIGGYVELMRMAVSGDLHLRLERADASKGSPEERAHPLRSKAG